MRFLLKKNKKTLSENWVWPTPVLPIFSIELFHHFISIVSSSHHSKFFKFVFFFNLFFVCPFIHRRGQYFFYHFRFYSFFFDHFYSSHFFQKIISNYIKFWLYLNLQSAKHFILIYIMQSSLPTTIYVQNLSFLVSQILTSHNFFSTSKKRRRILMKKWMRFFLFNSVPTFWIQKLYKNWWKTSSL